MSRHQFAARASEAFIDADPILAARLAVALCDTYVVEVSHDGVWVEIDRTHDEIHAQHMVDYFGDPTASPQLAGRPATCTIAGSYSGMPLRYRRIT